MLGVYSFFKEVIANLFVGQKIITVIKYPFKIGLPENSRREGSLSSFWIYADLAPGTK